MGRRKNRGKRPPPSRLGREAPSGGQGAHGATGPSPGPASASARAHKPPAASGASHGSRAGTSAGFGGQGGSGCAAEAPRGGADHGAAAARRSVPPRSPVPPTTPPSTADSAGSGGQGAGLSGGAAASPGSPRAPTASELLRAQGNEKYTSVREGMPGVLVLARLDKAQALYQQSLQAATTDDERASALKNLAMCSLKQRLLDKSPEQPVAQACSLLALFSAAADAGVGAKPRQWVAQCREQAEAACQEVLSHASERPTRAAGVSVLERCRRELDSSMGPKGGQTAFALLALADKLHSWSVMASQEGDHARGMHVIADAKRPLQEALAIAAHGTDVSLMALAQKQELLVFYQESSCQAMQLRAAGDALAGSLRRKGVAASDADSWMGVVDLYQQSLVCVLGEDTFTDIEAAAVSSCRLGLVYDAQFQAAVAGEAAEAAAAVLRTKAQHYLLKALNLAQSLWPKVFVKEQWHKDLLSTLSRYQRQIREEDEAAQAKNKAEVLLKLKPVLEEMKRRADQGACKLLPWLYDNHPPKIAEHRLKEAPSSENTKRLLLDAIRHWHPDKQKQAGFPADWCILCEEITKVLTSKYEIFKC